MDIRQFIANYKNGCVQVTEDVSYELRDVIKASQRLRHGIFSDPKFADGTKKIFYNVAQGFSNIIYRNTDLDTKDIDMRALNGKGLLVVDIFKLGVRSWMRNSNFASIENDMRKELIDMGHVVTKFVNYKTEIVDLLKIIVPPHAKSIDTAGCVEEIQMTWEEVLANKEDWKDEWETVEKVKNALDKAGDIYFTIYEHWKVDDFYDKAQKKKVSDKGCVKYLDLTPLEADFAGPEEEWDPYLEVDRFLSPYTRSICSKYLQKKLGKETERIYPYTEEKFINLPGRWLGFGTFELLSGLQEDYNEKLNLKRKFDRLALRGILVHTKSEDINKSRTLTQEFLNNIETGVAISLEYDEELERLNLGSTTSDTVVMIDKLFELMRVIIGITQETTGEKTPSTTTATVGIINQKVAQTTYDVVVEQQSLLLTRLFRDFVLPEVIAELDAEEVYELTGTPNDFMRLDRVLVEQMVWRAALQMPVMPTEEEVNAEIERQLQVLQKQGDRRYAEMKKSLLKDVNYMVEFYVNSESFDKQTLITNIQNMLQNPLYSGSRKALEAELRDLIGLYGSRYEKTEEEIAQEMAQLQMKTAIETGALPNQLPEDQQFQDDNSPMPQQSPQPQQ